MILADSHAGTERFSLLYLSNQVNFLKWYKFISNLLMCNKQLDE